MKRWEYLVQERAGNDPMLDKTLTYYGADGWELVTVLPYDGSNLNRSAVRLIFKRAASPKRSEAKP